MVAILASVSGCVSVKKIQITSFNIESISPKGLKAIDGTISLGVDNGSKQFTISDIEGTVSRKGTEIGTFTVDPITVAAKTKDTYKSAGSLDLNGNVSVLQVISLAKNFKVDEYTMDISMKFKVKGGASKKYEMEDVSVRQFVNMLNSQSK